MSLETLDNTSIQWLEMTGCGALKPRCFRNFNVNLYADYTANKKALMTMVLFNDWLKSFNSKKEKPKT
jgi:hypothetical protein